MTLYMRFLVSVVFFVSVLLFFGVNISPEQLSYAGLVPVLIPVFLLINFVLLVILVLLKRKLLILPLVAILLGWRFVGDRKSVV